MIDQTSPFDRWVIVYLLVLLTLTLSIVAYFYMRRQVEAVRAARSKWMQDERRSMHIARLSSDGRSTFEGPEGEAHVLKFSFDLGPGLSPSAVASDITDAVALIEQVTKTSVRTPDDQPQIVVAGLEYKNPLEIVLYIWAGQAAIAGIVGAAVGINAGVQQVRRSISGTSVVEAQNRELVSRADAMSDAWKIIDDALDGRLDGGDRERLGLAAQMLRGVEYKPPVPPAEELEAAEDQRLP